MDEKIIAGVIGLLTGALGSLVAPWIKWGIEKKKLLYDSRKAMVASWRAAIQNNSVSQFTTTPEYGTLWQYMDDEEHDRIENTPLEVSKKELLRTVAQVEDLWGLL